MQALFAQLENKGNERASQQMEHRCRRGADADGARRCVRLECVPEPARDPFG